jgi:hypothetical protein
MRNSVMCVGLGVALAAGTSAARAQTVETIATPAVVAQAPVAVPPSGVVLPPASAVAVTAPVETVETVRTVTTTEPRRVHRRVVHPRPVDRVTTVTRTTTTVRPGVVATTPVYDELMRGPRLYDVATPAAVAPVAQPAIPAARVAGATTAVGGPVVMPTYRYVYQPDRILVIDPYTNIAVQAIPR